MALKKMEVGYLKKVLHGGLGANLRKENQSHLQDNEPAFIRLHKPLRSRFSLDSTFWDKGYESETPGGEITSQEIPGASSKVKQLGTMSDHLSGEEQNEALSHHVHKPKPEESGKKGIETGVPGKTKHDLGRLDKKKVKRERSLEQRALQYVEDKVKSDSGRFHFKESDRTPNVEVIGEEAMRLSKSDLTDPQRSASLLTETKDESAKSNESEQGQTARKATIQRQEESVQQKTSLFRGTTDEQNQEKQRTDASLLTESSRKGKIQVTRESKPEQPLYDYVRPLPQESNRVELQSASAIEVEKDKTRSRTPVHTFSTGVRPLNKRRKDSPFSIRYPQETENQLSQIKKEFATLKRKLEDHIRQGEQQRLRPKFLPRRPPSRNLGGWSNLERNFIK